MKLNQQETQHLLLRLGFGENYETIKSYVGKSPEDIISEQFRLCEKNSELDYRSEQLSTIEKYAGNYSMMKEKSREERKEISDQLKAIAGSLNGKWLKVMTSSASGVQDKMAFFWHDHFACESKNPKALLSYTNTIRGNALGNFGDMLRAVSKEPAMLNYLNNQQNKKKAPNENFAREVMELFTLGRDKGYTETDIREAARAFTGWAGNKAGKFVVIKKHHDSEEKTIFGKTGNLDGDDVLDMLLENKQTAKHISQKWVKYFVHQDGNPALEKKVANAFYSSNYDIKTALTVLFTAKEFYQSKNIGTRIKSPIELIVSMQRMLNVSLSNGKSLMYLQKMMGQQLFNPPNVAGWPDGRAWVDSSTLMFRLTLPKYIFKAAILDRHPNESFDDNDTFMLKKKLKRLDAKIDYQKLKSEFKKSKGSDVAKFLIQEEDIAKEDGVEEKALIDQIVYFTSKPEFQLC